MTDRTDAGPDPRRFLRDGRLESLPRRWRDKVAVVRLLATRALPVLLEPVGERELTRRLAELCDDPVGLRRAMVDVGILHRTKDGAEYWRTERTEHDEQHDQEHDQEINPQHASTGDGTAGRLGA